MSQHNVTSNSWFEQYFEDRLTEMEPYLRNWANARYNTLDEATRDEAMQRTRITLWEKFQADPETWAAKTPRTWTQFAKTVYGHSLYSKKERVINRRFVATSDLETQSIRDGDAEILDFLGSRSPVKVRESRDFYLAELRIDLDLAIKRGMEQLDTADQDDMRNLMAGIMAGYTRCDLARKHGWSRSRQAHLSRLLRTVFYEALTGDERDLSQRRRAEPSAAEIRRIAALMDQGLGSYKIAACMGRSPSWALEHMTRIKRARRESSDDLVRFATDELGAVLVEGTDWPIERDGENLAPMLADA